MTQGVDLTDNISNLLEVLFDNAAFVKGKIEARQKDFHLVVGDFDPKLQRANELESPKPSKYIGFQYYRAMNFLDTASARYIRKRYEQADKDITGLGLLDYLYLVEITFYEAKLIENHLPEISDLRALENIKTWIHIAITLTKRVNDLFDSWDAPESLSFFDGDARRAQASLKVELNKSNLEISKAENSIRHNFTQSAPFFYSSLTSAEDLSSLILDQQIRIQLYRSKTDKILETIPDRNEARDRIWALSDIGRPIPQSGPHVLVERPEEDVELLETWQRIEREYTPTDAVIDVGGHDDFEDLEIGDPHPQYLLRSGDKLEGDVSTQDLLDGLSLSGHRHTGEDGSQQISGSDILPGTLRDDAVDSEDLPSKPENLSVSRMSLDVISAGFSVIDTHLEWDGEDQYLYEIESRLIPTDKDFIDLPFDDYLTKIWISGYKVNQENEQIGPALYAVDIDSLDVTNFSDFLPTFKDEPNPELVKTSQGTIASDGSDAFIFLETNGSIYRRKLPFLKAQNQDLLWEELADPIYADALKDHSLASDGRNVAYIADRAPDLILNFSLTLGETWITEVNPTLPNSQAVTSVGWSNGRWYRWNHNRPESGGNPSPVMFEWLNEVPTPPSPELILIPTWTEDFEGSIDDFTLSDENVSLDASESHTGSRSLKLDGNNEDDTTRTATVTLDLEEDGTVSFWRKVSSENGWDFLRFYINDSLEGSWSGVSDWTEFSYSISSGVNTLKWEYVKDGSVSSGQDAGWIDDVSVGYPTYLPVPPEEQPTSEDFVWTSIALPEAHDMVNISISYAGSQTWIVTAGDGAGYDDFYYVSKDDGATWQNFGHLAVRGYTNTAWRGGGLTIDANYQPYTFYAASNSPESGSVLPTFPIHPDLNWDIEERGFFKDDKVWYISKHGVLLNTDYRAQTWKYVEIDTNIQTTGLGQVLNWFAAERVFGHPDLVEDDIGKPGAYIFLYDNSSNDWWGQGKLLILDRDDPTQYTEAFSLPEALYQDPDSPYPLFPSDGYAPEAATVALYQGVPSIFVLTDRTELWRSKNLNPAKKSDWELVGVIGDPNYSAAGTGPTFSIAAHKEKIKGLLESSYGSSAPTFNYIAESYDGGKTWSLDKTPYNYGVIQQNRGFWWRYSGATSFWDNPQYGISQDGTSWQDYQAIPILEDIESMAWRSDGDVGLAIHGTTLLVTETGGEIWVQAFEGAWACWVDINDNLIMQSSSGIYRYETGKGTFTKVANALSVGDRLYSTRNVQGLGLASSNATINTFFDSDNTMGWYVTPDSDDTSYTRVDHPTDLRRINATAYYDDKEKSQPIPKEWLIRPGIAKEWGGGGISVSGNPYLNPTILFSVNTAGKNLKEGDLMILQSSGGGYSGFSYYTEWYDLPTEWNYIYAWPLPSDGNFTYHALAAYKFVDADDVTGRTYDFYFQTRNDNFANQGNAQAHYWNVTVNRDFNDIVGFGTPTWQTRFSGGDVWSVPTPTEGNRTLVTMSRRDQFGLGGDENSMIFDDDSGVLVWKPGGDNNIKHSGGRSFPGQTVNIKQEAGSTAIQHIGLLPVYIKNEISSWSYPSASASANFGITRFISGATTGVASSTSTFQVV